MGTDHRPSQPPRALPSPYLYTLLYTKEATERLARHLLSSRKEGTWRRNAMKSNIYFLFAYALTTLSPKHVEGVLQPRGNILST